MSGKPSCKVTLMNGEVVELDNLRAALLYIWDKGLENIKELKVNNDPLPILKVFK